MELLLLPLVSGDLLPTSLNPTISSEVAEFLRSCRSTLDGCKVTG